MLSIGCPSDSSRTNENERFNAHDVIVRIASMALKWSIFAIFYPFAKRRIHWEFTAEDFAQRTVLLIWKPLNVISLEHLNDNINLNNLIPDWTNDFSKYFKTIFYISLNYVITIQPVKAPENIVPNLGYVWNLKGYSKLNSYVILNNIYSRKRSRDQGGAQVFISCLGVRELKKVGNCLCSSVIIKSGLDGTKEVELVFAGFKKSKSLNNVFLCVFFSPSEFLDHFSKKCKQRNPLRCVLSIFFCLS